ncbi:MAG: ROK family protein [Nitrosarchaeum sp.]|nr:ROK family protein [Nitrosarchaeum sp.]
MYKLGIDLGGTKIEAILLDEHHNTIQRKRVPTPQNDYHQILDAISSLATDLLKNIEDYSMGICTPGAISKKTGLIKNSNTQCLIGKSLKEHVIMGTGVGGGIVIDKKIHQGRTNIAGEWGHHTLHQNGNNCYCGKQGCVETYISGPALEKRWKELTGRSQSMPEIIQNLDNPKAKQWKNEFLENFGFGLANVIDILDPDVIVLGGGLSNVNFLYTEGKDSVYHKVFSDLVDTPILKNKLGDSAGVFGAALL